MNAPKFRGVGPALVTPMFSDGTLDLPTFRAHVERVIQAGVHFVVPCGTTGESATMTPEEQAEVIACCVEVVDGRVPVMAGAGTNDTRDAAALASRAAAAGADAILSVSPYYNKPTQEGIYRHYAAVAEAARIPVFVYNVPGRTSSNVAPETLFRLAEEVEWVSGIKEASGNLAQVMTLLSERPDGVTVLSGDDDLTYPFLAMGADGVISVAANEVPGSMAALCDAVFEGDMDRALALHWRLLPLLRANFVESNPIPVKTAMEILGHFEAHFRLPLVPMSEGGRATLENALRVAGAFEDAGVPAGSGS